MGAVLAQQHLCAAQLAVVVVAHGRTVCTGIMDIDDIANVDLGQHTVDGKLVVVLTQTAHHIIHMVAGLVFLAQHSDVMVCAIHGGTHQVGSAGVQTDVLLIDMLFVDGRCHQSTVGAGGKAAHLGKDGHITHAGRHQDLLKLSAHALTDGHDVIFGLLRTVRDTHTAGQVDVADVHAGGLLHPDCQLEQDACQLRIVFIGNGVGGEESVDAEVPGTLCSQLLVAFDHLLLGHTILGIAGLVHDLKALFALAQTEGAARVIAAEDVLRHAGDTLQKFHHGGVVQIDIGTHLVGLLHIFHGSLVGGEHDIAAGEAAHLAEHQLGQGRAVHAAALLLEDLQDDRVRQSLDGKILLEAFVPAECLVDAAGIFTDALLVVDMERRGHILNDLLCHRLGQKRFLFHSNIPLILYTRGRLPQ